MHISQGTLDTTTALMTSAAGLFALGAALLGARRELKIGQLPSLLASSVFVLIAHQVDCATGFAFSGHLLGAALLAVLFGPYSAMLSMAAVLVAQATLLGDGSITTLGANFLVMGTVAPWTAYAVFRILQGRRLPRYEGPQMVALGLSAFLSSLAAATLLGLICKLPLLAMAGPYLAIGVMEALLSVSVFALILKGWDLRPGVAPRYALKPIAAVCLLALCLLPLSSEQPDGLTHVIGMTKAHTVD